MDEVKKEKRTTIEVIKIVINFLFLIVLVFAIISLIGAIGTIIKYKDVIKNPMGACMDQFNLSLCSCYYNNGGLTYIKSTSANDSWNRLIPKESYETNIPNFSRLNLTSIK